MVAATDALITEAVKKWKKNEEVIDDCTCVVVQLNPFTPEM